MGLGRAECRPQPGTHDVGEEGGPSTGEQRFQPGTQGRAVKDRALGGSDPEEGDRSRDGAREKAGVYGEVRDHERDQRYEPNKDECYEGG